MQLVLDEKLQKSYINIKVAEMQQKYMRKCKWR